MSCSKKSEHCHRKCTKQTGVWSLSLSRESSKILEGFDYLLNLFLLAEDTSICRYGFQLPLHELDPLSVSWWGLCGMGILSPLSSQVGSHLLFKKGSNHLRTVEGRESLHASDAAFGMVQMVSEVLRIVLNSSRLEQLVCVMVIDVSCSVINFLEVFYCTLVVAVLETASWARALAWRSAIALISRQPFCSSERCLGWNWRVTRSLFNWGDYHQM